MIPAIFLDRDGTLIEDRGNLRDPSEVVFYPETAEALHRLQHHFLLFIVTHQAGVGQGAITLEQAQRVSQHVVDELAKAGVSIREVYCCPHVRTDGCTCIKPRDHFLKEAERVHAVDLRRSFVVGDHPADVEMAANAGARGVYVLSGHGSKHRSELKAPCEIVPGIEEATLWISVTRAVEMLRAGRLVAFPTETVYGLGADAQSAAAVRAIFDVKGRPTAHPLIVHLAEADKLDEWAVSIPDLARRLAERFWPGPLTMVLRRAAHVPLAVTGGQETVGLRVPSHPLALRMLRAFGGGVAAPSANRFGRVSPTTAQHVVDDLGSDVDFILDGGACAVGVESTILDLSGEDPAILRPGGVTREELEGVLGRRIPIVEAGSVRAPGMLTSHYAPRAEVVLATPAEVEEQVGERRARGQRVTTLALAGNVEEMARRLYASLREIDREGFDAVVVSVPSEEGLGLAIVDRLRKAAGPRIERGEPKGDSRG